LNTLKRKITAFILDNGLADDDDALIAYCDKGLKYRYANKAHLQWFGKTPGHIVENMLLPELLGPFLFGSSREFIARALKGTKQQFECLVVLPSGEIKKAKTTYVPDAHDGVVVGFFIHSFDIRRTKKVAETKIAKGIEKANVAPVDNALEGVVQTLKNAVLTQFPGISNIARKHTIPETTLKVAFKKAHNTTIFNYYRVLQMDLAHKYISQKIATKAEMALKFGFANPSNFYACYNRYTRQNQKPVSNGHIIFDKGDRYNVFIEQLPVASAIIDMNFSFIAASPMWLAVFKIMGAAINGKRISQILPGLGKDFAKTLKSSLKANETHIEETLVALPDGSSSWIRFDIKPWYQNAKFIGGLIIFATDVTSLKSKSGRNNAKPTKAAI